ncbi:hypothetical protein MUN84_07465 [Hymenobacter sp. 5516J-16]|uniref:DUF4421 domain-containing protein n=1 Tax=Hymenobacter sublimis TaxID=2933777 RepID=A0ABY4J9A1_9BACT|nr:MULTISPECIES: hypothetical protein [Hymenobacter]UOQ78403.1 hypothetical protein MUN84_07465 [Hymenobacter sp. 5516J-16]UPL48377.1 hypothetical protein MWH26_14410 [Hymenobacter sublimis]
MGNTRFSTILILTLVAGLGNISVGWAQLDNRAFQYTLPVGPAYERQLRLDVQGFLFNKDNEYFNKIDPGLTYFGAQLAPRLVYFPSANLRLEAGVFLWKDYGTPRLRQVRPLFTLKYRQGYHNLIFGNLEGHLNHGYIEPMFDFERVITNRLEEGVQYQYQTPRSRLDAWVNWERQQYRFSNFQEEVAGGLSAERTLLGDSTGWLLKLPFQFTATHRGGQLDTIDKPLQTLFNLATGVRVRRALPYHLVQAAHFDGYVTYFTDYSFTRVLPFASGTGLYLNAGLDTRLSNLQLAYWQGSGYISPIGGRLYQSVSVSVADPDYIEKQRQLLILRVLRDYRLPGNVTLTTRFEPLYDLNNGLFDFSFALYLNFNQSFLLTTLKRAND